MGKILKIKNDNKSKFDGQKKLNRIVEIMNLLDSQKKVSIKCLCGQFGVSVRTIQRDLNSVEMQYPIIRDEKGYVSFPEGTGLRKKELTPAQKAALVMIMEVAKNLGGYMEKTFTDLISAMTDTGNTEAEIIPIMPSRLRSGGQAGFIEEINNAISFNQVLKIKYSYGPDEAREREICPIKLLFSEGFLYLLAFLPGNKKEYRTFRFDKILSVEILPERTFNTPENIARIVRASNIWGIREGKKTPIELRISGWAVDYFRMFEEVQRQKIKENGDGSVTLTGNVTRFQEIIPQILRWIPCVKVSGPPGLKKEVNKLVGEYLEKQ